MLCGSIGEIIDQYNVPNIRALKSITSCIKSWLGSWVSGCGALWRVRQSCGLPCNWKKTASPSAALTNRKDETLVTLKKPRFIQWRYTQERKK